MSKPLIFLIIVSLGLRLFGLNWDQGFHLHPDERFLTMVATAMEFSGNYFDTQASRLNPHNLGYPFYVYGTWPTILTKLVATVFHLDNYAQLILVGRSLSAMFDTGTVVLIYFIALHLFKNYKSAFFSSLTYSLAVLPIQLSHFFAVDTFLVFALTASLYLGLTQKYLLLGIFYGLAISTKITALALFPVLILFIIYSTVSENQKIQKTILPFAIGLLISVRLFYPYLFDGLQINQAVIANWLELKRYEVPGYFPPSIQWLNTAPYLYLLINTAVFGLGITSSIIFLISIPSFFKQAGRQIPLGIILVWVVGFFIYQAGQYAKPLRYLFPIYPAISILIGFYVSHIKNIKLVIMICLVISAWALGFMSIYSQPHTRVQASDWIIKNLPPQSTISCEYWDDCLPLYGQEQYQIIQLSPYDHDSIEKMSILLKQLTQIDYLILSSNRLYGSIPQAHQFYPYTSQFYFDLFNKATQFTKIAEFTSRPNWPIPGLNICLNLPYFNYGYVSKPNQSCTQPGISLVDDYAEESFTVYDHPKVTIFKNTSR